MARLAPEIANIDTTIRQGLEGGVVGVWIDAAVALTDFASFSGYISGAALITPFMNSDRTIRDCAHDIRRPVVLGRPILFCLTPVCNGRTP